MALTVDRASGEDSHLAGMWENQVVSQMALCQ